MKEADVILLAYLSLVSFVSTCTGICRGRNASAFIVYWRPFKGG